MALVTLQTIFQDAPGLCTLTHSPPTSESGPRHHAVSDRCVSGHIQACPDGHMTRVCTIRVGIAPAPNARTSRPSAGSCSSKRGCSPVTITMSSSRYPMISTRCGWPMSP